VGAEVDIPTVLGDIQDSMRGILSGEEDPYKAGRDIWGRAFTAATDSKELMWPLWLLWGALTDWVEVKPDEKDQAYEAMHRASREWLSVAQDTTLHKSYFERWLYEELGCERPEQ
jgi:hypothetical protein